MSDIPEELRAKEKIGDAKSWRGDVNVSMGSDTVTFKHRLLNENEFLRVKRSLSLSELRGDANENLGQTDAQERLLELQQKEEELTEAEEHELSDLTSQVASQTDQIEEALGDDGYDLLMEMGQAALVPSEKYVEYVYDSNPEKMRQHMGVGQLPNPVTKDVVRDHLEKDVVNMVEDQPFPIKLNVGMQSFSETLSILGNGFQK